MSSPPVQARVLLLTDAAPDPQSLATSLAGAGQHVVTVRSVAEALEHSPAEQWDAVVVERAPIEQTLDLVRRLHAGRPELATIVLSDDTSSATIRAGLDEGAFVWLVAPAPFEIVEAVILRARERRLLRGRPDPAAPASGITSATLHTINNQLGGIMGLAQLHLTDDDLPAELHDDLTMILQGARTIAELLKQLRALPPTP